MKQKQNTFSVLFYIRRAQAKKQGESAVMCRITVRGERENFTTRVSVPVDQWDQKSGRILGRSAKVMEQNRVLNDLQITLSRHYYDIEKRNGYATAEMVKNAYMGITAKAESLIPIYKEYLEETESLVGIQKSRKTYEKYERCYRRVVEFMREKYKISDIPLRDLKASFLIDFEVWLATKKGCAPNTIYKFMQLLRMPLLKAQRDGIIFPDPYNGYKMKKEHVDRGYLKEDDVLAIATKQIDIKRLDTVRDIFIFACYTGLAYSDIAALSEENIQKMFDGKMWIVTHRQKTKTMHHPKNWPYVGYGHRVLPGEPYRKGCQLTEAQADILLRKDLKKFCSYYRNYGKDSVLLGALAYNIGPGAVNKSTVLKLLKSGNRNIFKAYTNHCHYHGKFHKGLHQRRCMELGALYQP